MNAEKHHQSLIHHAVTSGQYLIGSSFIFQHDNDPKHTASAVKAYLGILSVTDGPPQSPKLSITEAVWDNPEAETSKKPGELFLRILTEMTESCSEFRLC